MNETLKIAEITSNRPLMLVEGETLSDRIRCTYDTIARRAFEIFEREGRHFGHELENWFMAEHELLHPVHVTVKELDGKLDVRAEVPGFEAKELEVSLEPTRLTISGKKEATEEGKKGKTIYEESCSKEILRIVDLPVAVEVGKAEAKLNNGVLEVMAPKAKEMKATAIEVKVA